MNKIQAEIAAYFSQPETRRKLGELGMVPAATTPEETLKRLQAEYQELGQVAREPRSRIAVGGAVGA